MLEYRKTTLRHGGSNCDGELGCIKRCYKIVLLSAVRLFEGNGLYDTGEGEWDCRLGLITHLDCFVRNLYWNFVFVCTDFRGV